MLTANTGQDKSSQKALAVIPARFASTRFPGKMLALLDGKPLVYHTYCRACRAHSVGRVIIATDDLRIKDALEVLGANVVMTRSDHASGTDRLAEVASDAPEEIIVNVQGDEPLLDPAVIDLAVDKLHSTPEAVASTACHLLHTPEDILNPNMVKVVRDLQSNALLFSRCPIPHVRDASDIQMAAGMGIYYKHIGLYVYRKDFLLRYAALPATPLEKLEKLEQLRIIEHGYKLSVVETSYTGFGVDTPEDLQRAHALLIQQSTL